MKNKLNLLLIPVLLIIPNVVKASPVCPHSTYDRIVTNPDGINLLCTTYSGDDCCKKYEGDKCVESKEVIGHLKQNERFTVQGNYVEGDEHILISTEKDGYFSIENFNGTKLAEEEIIPNDKLIDNYLLSKEEKSTEALIYADAGTDIKKGPAEAYSIVGHLEKGTKVNYIYYNYCQEYIYIEYNGLKGWIRTYDQVFTKEEKNYITTKDTNIRCANIPKNTIIAASYTMPSPLATEKILINYNNCQEVINILENNNFLEIESKKTEVAKTDIKVYEYYNNEGKILTTIPIGNEYLSYVYNYYSENNDNDYGRISYVSYNGIKGWIKLPKNNNTSQSNPQSTEDAKEPNYITTYIILCSIIVIMAIVIIILINKNKKKETN